MTGAGGTPTLGEGAVGGQGGTAGLGGVAPGGNSGAGAQGGHRFGVCNDKVITYQVQLPNGSLETRTHTCPAGCGYFYNGYAFCNDTDGMPPFRICDPNDISGQDCNETNYCVSGTATTRVLLDSPTCVESVCDWLSKQTVDCPGTSTCSSAGCRYNSTGVTSGGFPWMSGGTGGVQIIDAGSD
jgi:hypothetical protein